MNYKKIFCTFADPRLRKSLERIKKQAETMKTYDDILIYDERSLDFNFKIRFKDKLVYGSRGFGYWVWKPQVVLQAFDKMDYGDALNYMDAGCWLNLKGKKRLNEYFNMVFQDEKGILAFQVKNTFNDSLLDQFSLPEYKWTKGDLFDFFNVRNLINITHSEQIGAGIFFIKKNKFTEKFIREWLNVYEHNFRLADGSPSISPNFEGFIEHRHDQSIFGILCKIYDIKTISAFEYWYPSKDNILKPDWSKLKDYPIWAKRDKNYGFIGNLITYCFKFLEKFKKVSRLMFKNMKAHKNRL